MKLVSCIVPRGDGDRAAMAARGAGAGGGTVIDGRGTASRTWLELMGLGESQKEVAVFVVEDGVSEATAMAVGGIAEGRGVVFAADVEGFAKSGEEKMTLTTGGGKMGNGGKKLVCAIVNKGCAGDAMAAARKAGATGGTVVNARGTASEDDARFFGVRLVPEKEMLLILAEADAATAILDAIRALPLFSKKGSGIVFAVPVS